MAMGFDVVAFAMAKRTARQVKQKLDNLVISINQVNIDDNLVPTMDNAYDLGSIGYRWKDAWFHGNVGLGVIKNPGATITVDIIHDQPYVEVASDDTERHYSLTGSEIVTDWDIGTLNTYTENGVITGIELQFEAYTTTYDAYYEFYEDDVQRASIYIEPNSDYTSYSIEINTVKTSAHYLCKIEKQNNSGDVYVRNRSLMFRKRFIGIKAGG